MQPTTQSPWQRWIVLPLAAGLIALVAAVSSWAADSPSTDPVQSASPPQYQPVQESEESPAPPADDGPGGRDDCPEKDGRGAGPGAGADDSRSAPAPAAPSTTPEV